MLKTPIISNIDPIIYDKNFNIPKGLVNNIIPNNKNRIDLNKESLFCLIEILKFVIKSPK